MISVTLFQVAKILNAEVFGSDVLFNNVSTDTRKIIPGCLFVALQGKNFNGNDFAYQAKLAGASALLVNCKLDIDISQIIVKNTRLAFSKLASWVRRQVCARVIALTGSAGKTSVKEMVGLILNKCGNTLYTHDNLNNDIGVAMTLLRLTQKHKYAVIELSATRHGEIKHTVDITYPEVVLVNNLTHAHLDGLKTFNGVSRAKGEIYTGLKKTGIAILNKDSNDWLNWKKIIGYRKTWFFTLNQDNYADFNASNIHILPQGSMFKLHTPNGNIKVALSMPGLHNISNALAATALSMAVGAPLTAIKSGLADFKGIRGRLWPIFLNKTQLLLDDSYNANLGSMKAAIEVLSIMPGYKVMVVGDMSELGKDAEFYHAQIGEIIRKSNLDCVLSIGKLSFKISQNSGIGEHYLNKESLIIGLQKLLNKHQIMTILIKGSRNAHMEEIVCKLQKQNA